VGSVESGPPFMNDISSANLLPHHGSVFLFREFFTVKQADDLLEHFLTSIPWTQQPVKIFGREIPQPRLTASFADDGISYGYSGIELLNNRWTPELLSVKSRVEEKTCCQFNTALLNLYRDGKDYMGWHRDNEKDLGKDPPVASVSFGERRKFQLRSYQKKDELLAVELGHGDLLLMSGETQQFWEHRLPKNPGVRGPRLNITFRRVFTR
jgi:alkylated DNA repair dioxygenase AlkB